MSRRDGDDVVRYEILRLPNAIRRQNSALCHSYSRVCFDRKYVSLWGKKTAQLIALGSPLLDAVADATLERTKGALQQGTVLVDNGDEPRLLFIVRDAVLDGKGNEAGCSVHFLEMTADGAFHDAGNSPCVDCRALTDDEMIVARKIVAVNEWLKSDEATVLSYCQMTTATDLLEAEKERRLPLLLQEERDIKDRYFYRINEADAVVELAGTKGAQHRAASDADKLRQERQNRLDLLAVQKDLHSAAPSVLGRAIIIPAAMLSPQSTDGKSADFAADADERRRIEILAMQAVMDNERKLGFIPRDVSHDNCGYDIESSAPSAFDAHLRLIEVKGIAQGKDTVTLSRNEVNTALNTAGWILAIVEAADAAAHIMYLRNALHNEIEKAGNCTTYDIPTLVKGADVILDAALEE